MRAEWNVRIDSRGEGWDKSGPTAVDILFQRPFIWRPWIISRRRRGNWRNMKEAWAAVLSHQHREHERHMKRRRNQLNLTWCSRYLHLSGPRIYSILCQQIESLLQRGIMNNPSKGCRRTRCAITAREGRNNWAVVKEVSAETVQNT